MPIPFGREDTLAPDGIETAAQASDAREEVDEAEGRSPAGAGPSGLKLRREEMKATPEGTMKVSSDWKDYRAVKGVLFPHLIVQKGPVDMSLSVTEVLVNGASDAKYFAVD